MPTLYPLCTHFLVRPGSSRPWSGAGRSKALAGADLWRPLRYEVQNIITSKLTHRAGVVAGQTSDEEGFRAVGAASLTLRVSVRECLRIRRRALTPALSRREREQFRAARSRCRRALTPALSRREREQFGAARSRCRRALTPALSPALSRRPSGRGRHIRITAKLRRRDALGLGFPWSSPPHPGPLPAGERGQYGAAVVTPAAVAAEFADTLLLDSGHAGPLSWEELTTVNY